MLVLAGEPQRRAARGEHDQAGRLAQQLAHERRSGVDDLEVVEQQEGPAAAEERVQRGDRRLVALGGEPELARDRGRDQLRAREMREVGEVDAVGEPVGEVVAGLEREPRLADAPGPGQRHQARAAAQQRRQLRQVGLATHERRRRSREVPARAQLGRLDRERRVLLQDRALQLVQRGAGLEPELLAQRLPRLPEHLERVGLAVAPVQGEHELPAEPLAAPVLGNQRLELGDELAVVTERELRLDTVLERRQPQLLEPRHLCLRERLVADVLVGPPAPQPERLAEARLRRGGLAPRQLGAPARDEELEALEVQLAGRQPQPVPGPVQLDPLGAEAPAQPVHVDLQRVDGRRGRLLAPQRIDQPVARDDVSARDQQAREQRHLLARRQLDGAGGGGDLNGPEHAELHGCQSSVPTGRSASHPG